MKLVEAIKNLKTIQKRVEKNCGQISQYCSYVNVDSLAFENEERQRQEVSSLVQANIDLENEYLRLKRAIEKTNLETMVTIGDYKYSISDLISLRRVAGRFRVSTYNSLTPQTAMLKLQQVYSKTVDMQNPPRAVVLYKEEDKNKGLRSWEEFMMQIDGKLEVVNAETELLGY